MPQVQAQVNNGRGNRRATGPQLLRQDLGAGLVVSELQGRFGEMVDSGTVFSGGNAAPIALSANSITLTATAVPIYALYNPIGSGFNAKLLQAALQSFLNNVTSVAPGAYVWAYSGGNGALTLGSTPFNRNTGTLSGSVCKVFQGAQALTGLTNNLVVVEAADFPLASGLLTTTVAAATPTPSVGAVQNFDGSWQVPPGGVLALLNTISVTTHSVMGRLLWNEEPVSA